jgi:hypothetical protein
VLLLNWHWTTYQAQHLVGLYVTQIRLQKQLCRRYTIYTRFIPSFSDTARPLNKLTEKTAKFLWTDECESSFNSLKDKLTQAPILAYPCIQKPFILDTDASGFGIGAVLSQIYDDLHGEH